MLKEKILVDQIFSFPKQIRHPNSCSTRKQIVTWQNPPRQCPCPEHWLIQEHSTGTSQKRPQKQSYLQSHCSLKFTLRAYASAGSTLHHPGWLAFVVNILSRSALVQSLSLGPFGSEGNLTQVFSISVILCFFAETNNESLVRIFLHLLYLKATCLCHWTVWVFGAFPTEAHCSCSVTISRTNWNYPSSIW